MCGPFFFLPFLPPLRCPCRQRRDTGPAATSVVNADKKKTPSSRIAFESVSPLSLQTSCTTTAGNERQTNALTHKRHGTGDSNAERSNYTTELHHHQQHHKQNKTKNNTTQKKKRRRFVSFLLLSPCSRLAFFFLHFISLLSLSLSPHRSSFLPFVCWLSCGLSRLFFVLFVSFCLSQQQTSLVCASFFFFIFIFLSARH